MLNVLLLSLILVWSMTGDHNCRWCPSSYTSLHEPWWLYSEKAWKRKPHWSESWFSRPGILLHYVILEIYSLALKLLQWSWMNYTSQDIPSSIPVCYQFSFFMIFWGPLLLWLTSLCFQLVQLIMKSIDWHDSHSSFIWMMIWTCGNLKQKPCWIGWKIYTLQHLPLCTG